MPVPIFVLAKSRRRSIIAGSIHRIWSVFSLLLLLAGLGVHALAQGSPAGSAARGEGLFIVDYPGAGLLKKDERSVMSLIGSQGTVLLSYDHGLAHRVTIGASAMVTGLLGTGRPVLPRLPGISLRVRVFEESFLMPAIVVGFSNQGRGFLDADDRYESSPPGLFLAASRNYRWAGGTLALHGMVSNTTLAASPNYRWNVAAGAEQSLGRWLSLVAELNTALPEAGRLSPDGIVGSLAFRFAGNRSITGEFQLRNLAYSASRKEGFSRSIGVEWRP